MNVGSRRARRAVPLLTPRLMYGGVGLSSDVKEFVQENGEHDE
jgi:hypothetical protein